MSAVVELNSDAIGDLSVMRVMRVTMDRIPMVHEFIRVLVTIDGMTTAVRFQVTRVLHNATTNDYPKRAHELDAWVDCVAVRKNE